MHALYVSATTVLFTGAAAVAIGTIVTTVAPQRTRIVRLLLDGPQWRVDA